MYVKKLVGPCNAMKCIFCVLEIKRDNLGTCQSSEAKPEHFSVTSITKLEKELSSSGLHKGINSPV